MSDLIVESFHPRKITVAEFGHMIGVPPGDLVARLYLMGMGERRGIAWVPVAPAKGIDWDSAWVLATEFGWRPEPEYCAKLILRIAKTMLLT